MTDYEKIVPCPQTQENLNMTASVTKNMRNSYTYLANWRKQGALSIKQ